MSKYIKISISKIWLQNNISHWQEKEITLNLGEQNSFKYYNPEFRYKLSGLSKIQFSGSYVMILGDLIAKKLYLLLISKIKNCFGFLE